MVGLFILPAAHASTLGHFASGPKGVVQVLAVMLCLALAAAALVIPVALPLKLWRKGPMRAIAMTVGVEVLCIASIFGVWFFLLWLSQ